MPLEILLILVVGGIAGIALTLHLLGLSQITSLDVAAARQEWLRHYPDDYFIDAFEYAFDPRGRVCLLRSDQGWGGVWKIGNDATARRLEQCDWEETPNGVVFRFSDTGAPYVSVTLPASDRDLWTALLRKIKRD